MPDQRRAQLGGTGFAERFDESQGKGGRGARRNRGLERGEIVRVRPVDIRAEIATMTAARTLPRNMSRMVVTSAMPTSRFS